MLKRLGFRHFAYDWRTKDIPTFDAEVEALKKEGIALDAFWVAPGVLNPRVAPDPRRAPAARGQGTTLGLARPGGDRAEGDGAGPAGRGGLSRASSRWPRRRRRPVARSRSTTTAVGSASRRIRSPSSSDLKAQGINERRDGLQPPPRPRAYRPAGRGPQAGDALPEGREPQRHGPRPEPGAEEDPAAGTRVARPRPAPDDPRERIRGADRHPRPHQRRRRGAAPRQPRRPRLARSPSSTAAPPGRGRTVRTPVAALAETRVRRWRSPRDDPSTIAALLVEDARAHGDPPARGRGLRLGEVRLLELPPGARGKGGEVGPDLSGAGACLKPEEVVESILWPRLKVKEGYDAVNVATLDGQVRRCVQGLRDARGIRPPRPRHPRGRPPGESPGRVDPARRHLDARGTRRVDDPGRAARPRPVPARPGPARQATSADALLADGPRPGRVRLRPARSTRPATPPGNPVNRDRVYDFYAKEADHFAQTRRGPAAPAPLSRPRRRQARPLGQPERVAPGPTSDGTARSTWATLLSGVFRGGRRDRPQGRLRPPGRSTWRGLRLLQPRDPDLRRGLVRRIRQVQPPPGTASSMA